jgi:hypothetical protein
MARPLDIVLLLALPASGKSEVRTFLSSLSGGEALRDFHLGETVQLDDYPYVHLMRRISEELRGMGRDGVFFRSSDEPMLETRDWGTLIELVNEDYDDLIRQPKIEPKSAAQWLLDRYDAARAKVGAEPRFGKLDARTRAALADAIEADARHLLDEKKAEMQRGRDLAGKTIVIEFARGGPDGAQPPLPAPLGYQYSLARLSDPILERASILYIWVTPEESRRKNEARAKPGRDGDASILHHGVPIRVMLEDYGTDDMGHLIETSDRPNTVRVETRGKVFHLPVARFDNRVDKTSFIREDKSKWPPAAVRAIHDGLRDAMSRLAGVGR